MVAMFEMSDGLDKLCRSLSAGMRRKVSLLGALVQRPDLYILDEPIQPSGCRCRAAPEGDAPRSSSRWPLGSGRDAHDRLRCDDRTMRSRFSIEDGSVSPVP